MTLRCQQDSNSELTAVIFECSFKLVCVTCWFVLVSHSADVAVRDERSTVHAQEGLHYKPSTLWAAAVVSWDSSHG